MVDLFWGVVRYLPRAWAVSPVITLLRSTAVESDASAHPGLLPPPPFFCCLELSFLSFSSFHLASLMWGRAGTGLGFLHRPRAHEASNAAAAGI